MTDLVDVRTGAYYDSVSLMQVSTTVSRTPGVRAALVAMATELNVELLAGMGFTVGHAVGPNDLVVAIRGDDDAAVSAGQASLEGALAALKAAGASAGGFGEAPPPRTIGMAVRVGEANLALISVPGPNAFVEALDAVQSGVSVMLFSDNVPVAQEIALKDAARDADVLLMGPDCGTAVVAGVALGFANAARRGRVGLVAASGTGAQQVMCLLDAAGVGLSHCLGVGGRDLSAAVGGRSTRQALAALAADPATESVIVVSKPPAPEVLAAVTEHAGLLGKPVYWATLGAGRPDLTAAVEAALGGEGHVIPAWPSWAGADPAAPVPGALRGLFAGGTLADEAMLIAAGSLGPIRSNTPLSPELALGPGLRHESHVVIDFGDDAMTQGRAHPMIDPLLRLDRIATEAADPTCGVLLLDLVLGFGSHPDPAPDLAAAIRRAREVAAAAGRELPVVVSLIGVEADPQGLTACATALSAAGASVFLSNAAATRHAASLCAAGDPLGWNSPSGRVPEPQGHFSLLEPSVWEGSSTRGQRALLGQDPSVATAGASLFAEALHGQAVRVTEVDWRPPMEGTGADLARVMADPRRAGANAEAFARMTSAGAELVDVRPASEVLGLTPGTFLHAGPPLDWERASGPMRGGLIGAMLLEGLAATPEAAEAALARGDGITLEPCHHLGAVGPMAGIVSPSMWMFVLRDEAHDGTAYCTLNEGLGKVLRYGAYGPEVIERLRWMSAVLGPLLQAAVRTCGPVDIRAIIAQMLQMGDEGHNRNRAGTLMFLRDILPSLITVDATTSDVAEAVRFVGANDHFFLNLDMPACKLATAAAEGIPGSTVVTTMARNGTDFGIRVSGTGGSWFTGPALTPEGLFLGAFGPQDANPDIGDSAITETGGIGGFAMAAAPAIVRFVGGDVPFALRATRSMYEITVGEHPSYQIPILEFRGTPCGIDVTKVVRTRILPQINTGMAGAVAGTGQVGAGLVTPPAACFPAALAALADLVPHPLGE